MFLSMLKFLKYVLQMMALLWIISKGAILSIQQFWKNNEHFHHTIKYITQPEQS